MKHRRDPTPKLWEDPVAVRAHAFCATAATPRFDTQSTAQSRPPQILVLQEVFACF